MTDTWTKELRVGDSVSYHAVGLWDRRGSLLRFERGKRCLLYTSDAADE